LASSIVTVGMVAAPLTVIVLDNLDSKSPRLKKLDRLSREGPYGVTAILVGGRDDLDDGYGVAIGMSRESA
jgi:hypothetical protein